MEGYVSKDSSNSSYVQIICTSTSPSRLKTNSQHPLQPNWPVHVDHCFARIILDITVGINAPWMPKLKSPAYKNMSRSQLEASIKLGHQILDGDADLVELDNKSLSLRGIGKNASGKRVRVDDAGPEEGGRKQRKITSMISSYEKKNAIKGITTSHMEDAIEQDRDDLTPYLKKIALCEKTSFQKKVLTALCQVPHGQYTTYGAMAKHLSSSPRAVGNALKNNPFAPQVPCHRVLASGGGLGGFMGSWGRNGKEGLNDDKKRKLLRDEGVLFDGKGRVVGKFWDGFK
jgi:O-6-methylguanine DNA methyltransferase